jgi:hypothetical protein
VEREGLRSDAYHMASNDTLRHVIRIANFLFRALLTALFGLQEREGGIQDSTWNCLPDCMIEVKPTFKCHPDLDT